MDPRIAYLVVALGAAACSGGSSSSTQEPLPASASTSGSSGDPASGESTGTTSWNDTAMQALVAQQCASSLCHGGAQRPNLANVSEDAMRADTESLDAVRSGRMPKDGSLTAAERATFLAFYGQ